MGQSISEEESHFRAFPISTSEAASLAGCARGRLEENRKSHIRKQFWLCRGGNVPRIAPKFKGLVAVEAPETVVARVTPRMIRCAETASKLEPRGRLGDYGSAAHCDNVGQWLDGSVKAREKRMTRDFARTGRVNRSPRPGPASAHVLSRQHPRHALWNQRFAANRST